MIKKFKEIIAQNYQLPMPEQQNLLKKEFESRRGNLEQVDDIVII